MLVVSCSLFLHQKEGKDHSLREFIYFLPLVSHSWKVTAPMRLVTRLPPQGKQVVLPTSDWYVPSGHSRQGTKPSREYWPGKHWPEHTHLAKSDFKFVRQQQWIHHKYHGIFWTTLPNPVSGTDVDGFPFSTGTQTQQLKVQNLFSVHW